MAPNNLCDLAVVVDVAENFLANRRVPFHLTTLVERKSSRLLELAGR